jgi:hypothetical protein
MNYLKSINIKNYKCFNNVSFNVKDINVIIGENNAGKSTIIETIKLIAFGIEKANLGRFTDCPSYWEAPLTQKCIFLNIENLLIDINTSSYKYNGKPSIITAYFDNNIKTKLTICNNEVCFQIFQDTKCITNKKDFISLNISPILVMPHFNLLRDLEPIIDEKRTKYDRFNYRSSLHFRNELLIYKEYKPMLNDLLSQTWQGTTLEVDYNIGDPKILALVRDKDFTAEIKNYGSGLQMWVQILWFLCKINSTKCMIVLDEPDVYIHADLQRKLYQLVTSRFEQVIIATHSIEIINETKLSNILCVDKNSSRFNFCRDKTSLLELLSSIGTNQNFTFTKLQRYNKCLFVEGKDIDYLDYLFSICNKNKSISLKDFACCQLQGKNNYKEIFGAAKLFNIDSEGTFTTFCLLDRDYNEEFNKKIREDAIQNNVKLFILERIEIENYLIIPEIFAEISNKEIDFIKSKIIELAESLRGPTFDRILKEKVEEYKKIKSDIDISTISKETREFINSSWTTFDNIVKIVPGKELKGRIFEWLQTEYNIHMTDKILFRYYKMEYIPQDLMNFLIEIAK